ncbi:MAG TPA: heparinase II/III-family protein, partial [Anaerolineales bacterium]|nr:heparinase II/III-family protein [Anaerolineales bacterium]
PLILRTNDSWGYLRAARFNSRPGHADQLHLDLWWRGLNVAQDAGTYLYNAPPPWDNSLSQTEVHNTITVEGQDQMTRAGRFLWLDWAQGEVLEHNSDGGRMSAQHDGYRRWGVLHQRAVECREGRWIITDNLIPAGEVGSASRARNSPLVLRLHWVLPDWPWAIEDLPAETGTQMLIQSPYGWIKLRVKFIPKTGRADNDHPHGAQLIRAGELVHGTGSASAILGWVSHSYGYKEPALSLSIETESPLPVTIITQWDFPRK